MLVFNSFLLFLFEQVEDVRKRFFYVKKKKIGFKFDGLDNFLFVGGQSGEVSLESGLEVFFDFGEAPVQNAQLGRQVGFLV